MLIEWINRQPWVESNCESQKMYKPFRIDNYTTLLPTGGSIPKTEGQ